MFGEVRVAVVIPAYQEALHVGRTVTSVPDWVDRVIVVDDGSRDRTAGAARAAGDHRVIVVRHDENRGVGAAIVTGYDIAFGEGSDIAVVMAGDGQMDPLDLPGLVSPVAAGLADYAKGDRFSWPGVRKIMPFGRWLGGQVFSWLTRRITGLSVRDSQCGYTALSRRGADRLDLDALWPGYGYPNDLLARAAEARLVVRDVQVRPVYQDEQSGLGLRQVFFVLPRVLYAMWRRRLRGRAAAGLPVAARGSSAAR